MYPNPIPLNNGAEVVNYDFRGADANSSRYQGPVGTNPLDMAPVLSIAHQTTQVNTVHQKRRSKFRIDHPVADAAGNRDTLSVYLNVVIPERITDVDTVESVLTEMKNFLTNAGYITRITNGEV